MSRFEHEEFSTDHILELYQSIKKKIESNTDNRIKDVGDRVKVWDGSGNVDKKTNKKRFGIDILFEQESIIIETGCKIYSEKTHVTKDGYLCDLLLRFPGGEEVYCSSEFVKRIDNYEN